MKSTHVKLVYFKSSGKYYSEAEFDIQYQTTGPEADRPVPFWECVRQVKHELKEGRRPGLVDCPWEENEFHVHITVYTEYGPLPWLQVAKGNM